MARAHDPSRRKRKKLCRLCNESAGGGQASLSFPAPLRFCFGRCAHLRSPPCTFHPLLYTTHSLLAARAPLRCSRLFADALRTATDGDCIGALFARASSYAG
ncbi:hypothetical protein MRX96_010385 [Rhipicephalus microplus]